MLDQPLADELLALPKAIRSGDTASIPPPGGHKTFTVLPRRGVQRHSRERFYLDVTRGKRDPGKYWLHLRVRNTVGLMRLCAGGTAHENPAEASREDLIPYAGQSVRPPHLHVYVEGDQLNWVIPLPAFFTRPESLEATLVEFLSYCEIASPGGIQESF